MLRVGLFFVGFPESPCCKTVNFIEEDFPSVMPH
jgi:hypothetical protein